MYKHPVENTLIINRWDSRCGNCGEGADPTESHHATVVGFGIFSEAHGCGTEFMYIGTDYVGKKFEKVARKMRPDLAWNDYELDD